MNKQLIKMIPLLALMGISMDGLATQLPVTTMNGDPSDAVMHLQAWDARHTIEHEAARFVGADRVNLSAIIQPDEADIGQSADIFVVAFYNGNRFMKDENGNWVAWTDALQAAETRTLKAEEYVSIVSGLTGLIGEFDIFVGYRNAQRNIVYNQTSMHFEVTDGYDSVLTVGDLGPYYGCNGLQRALSHVQDWGEIRIQQGTLNCSGLDLTDDHNYEHGIKISGGWDREFETQSDDADLTVLDGGNPIIEDITTHDACVAAGGWSWGDSACYVSEPMTARILNLNNERVLIENLTFQNGYHVNGGSALAGVRNERNLRINNCHFYNNTTVSGYGGAVLYAGAISNSLFEGNVAYYGGALHRIDAVNDSVFRGNRSVYNGGAISTVSNVINSTFEENTANAGGAIYTYQFDNVAIINNVFTNNQTLEENGGAVYADGNGHKVVNNLFNGNTSTGSGGAVANTGVESTFVNNTFVNNVSGGLGGGAFYGVGTILNSVFDENRYIDLENEINEYNDITSRGNLSVDYSAFTAYEGAADIGPNNLFEGPLFSGQEGDEFGLQAASAGVDSGSAEYLYLSVDNSVDAQNYLLPYARNASGAQIDLNGQPRVSGDVIDMGAFERQ
ncbi:MAG: right-handed parallel beta-helix repeat-containing protein [Candidatus Thiodiazotropha sp.]